MEQRRDVEPIPMLDLRLQSRTLREELLQAFDDVLSTAAFADGPAVARFENEFARYCGAPHCVAVSSGTSALHVAAQCLDLGPGDEVITVSMSFVATAWPILYLGARPVFVDIDPNRFTLDPRLLESAITANTKAIIVVHLYGQCADMDPILEIARARKVAVIEDCAQAHGATYKGRRAGTMGVFGCFSFYPSKNLGACGEGGGLITNDQRLADRARSLRDHAQDERYLHSEVGYNYRMDGIQGAILSVKLKHLDEWTRQRRTAAAEYDRLLADSPLLCPVAGPDSDHVRYLYVVRHPKRDAIRDHLGTCNIATSVHYPVPIHLQPALRAFGYKPNDLPVTEEWARTCLSLPLYPEITHDQIRHVVEAINHADRP